MPRIVLAALVVSVFLPAFGAHAEPVTVECPAYAAQVQRARGSLVAGNRAGAIAALREAQRELAECIRRESNNADTPVLLAVGSPVLQPTS